MCIVDITALDETDSALMGVIGQVASPFGARAPYPLVKDMWARGGEGLTLFHSSDAKLSLCISKDTEQGRSDVADQSTAQEKRYSVEANCICT